MSDFLKSQQQPFRAEKLPHTMGSYADCTVCLNYRDVGHDVRADSCRFQKGSHKLENHFRAHLYYKSFFCLICRQCDFQFANTVTLTSDGRSFAFVRAPHPGDQLRTTRQSVRQHIVRYHLKQVSSTSGKIVVDINSLIGSAPILPLESLIQATVTLHQRNLTAIRSLKNKNNKNKDTGREALLQLKDKKPEVIEKLSKIRMSPEKSYFTISAETDQMLNDIDEVLAAQADLMPMDSSVTGSPVGSVSPISLSSEFSRTITLTSADSDIEILPESQITVPVSEAAAPGRKRRAVVRKNIRKKPAPVSLLRPSPPSSSSSSTSSSSSSAGSSGTPARPAARRGRPPRRIQDARRRLTFNSLPELLPQSVPFLQTVNPYAPGVVFCKDEPELDFETHFIPIQYSREVEEIVDQLIREYVAQSPELMHLTGKVVSDILMELPVKAEAE
jgi:hypothetical protein